MVDSRISARKSPTTSPPVNAKKVKIRVLRAACVMIFGKRSAKISGSKNADWTRCQSIRKKRKTKKARVTTYNA